MSAETEIRDVNKVHFFNLDVLRFVAAFMVVFVHGFDAYAGWFGQMNIFKGPGGQGLNTLGEYTNRFMGNLGMGVEFFFLISGFLITFLLLKEKNAPAGIHVGKFYIRRALRIWPLYFIVVAIAPFWCAYLDSPQPDYRWVATFTTNFQTIFTGKWEFPFQHYWSICIEEHFYVVWPWLILLIPMKRMPLVFGLVIFISIVFRAYVFIFNIPEWHMHVFMNTISRIDVLAIGALVAWYHYHKPIVINVSRGIRVLVYIVAIFALAIESNKEWGSIFLVSFRKYFYVLIFLFGFLNYMFNPDAFFQFKKKNFIHYLGKISFGIYIYHNILFHFIVTKIMWRFQITSVYYFWFIYLVMVIGIAIISYELFEKQILKFKDRFALIKTER